MQFNVSIEFASYLSNGTANLIFRFSRAAQEKAGKKSRFQFAFWLSKLKFFPFYGSWVYPFLKDSLQPTDLKRKLFRIFFAKNTILLFYQDSIIIVRWPSKVENRDQFNLVVESAATDSEHQLS